jgi:hypothetical protein
LINTLDTSLLDRWAEDLKVHAKIKYVTPKRGFGVTYHSFCVRCIRANSRLNFEITLLVCVFQALFALATVATEVRAKRAFLYEISRFRHGVVEVFALLQC